MDIDVFFKLIWIFVIFVCHVKYLCTESNSLVIYKSFSLIDVFFAIFLIYIILDVP